ncbi:hypothetical protein QR680_003568 [Steinernema hermaphroditum]|uniref:Uncharacterized protein n=1 Tax=Steinernema hermaphroditum TaxID=289476 RepID=A0AA39LSB2_9BILA|nr:hypothetical protein QR680_003568 [Steinernema hermaphroditum]
MANFQNRMAWYLGSFKNETKRKIVGHERGITVIKFVKEKLIPTRPPDETQSRQICWHCSYIHASKHLELGTDSWNDEMRIYAKMPIRKRKASQAHQ